MAIFRVWEFFLSNFFLWRIFSNFFIILITFSLFSEEFFFFFFLVYFKKQDWIENSFIGCERCFIKLGRCRYPSTDHQLKGNQMCMLTICTNYAQYYATSYHDLNKIHTYIDRVPYFH